MTHHVHFSKLQPTMTVTCKASEKALEMESQKSRLPVGNLTRSSLKVEHGLKDKFHCEGKRQEVLQIFEIKWQDFPRFLKLHKLDQKSTLKINNVTVSHARG